MKRIVMLASFVLLVSISSAFAADPFKVHEKGFGPKIQELQLGAPMTWSEMVLGARKLIGSGIDKTVPFTVFIADSLKGVERGRLPSRPGKWVAINIEHGLTFNGTVIDGSRGVISKLPKSASHEKLFAILKKNGLNFISTGNITLNGERIIQYSLHRDTLQAFNDERILQYLLHSDSSQELTPLAAPTADELAQWVSNAYNLGTMEKKGENYEVGNASEGWQVLVDQYKVKIMPVPIPE